MKRFLALFGALVIVACGGPSFSNSTGPSVSSPTMEMAGSPKNKSPYKTCPDGTRVRTNQKCSTTTTPPPTTKTCPDGSTVPYNQACPTPPAPTPDPTPIPTTQTCWDGSVIPLTSACPTQPPPPDPTAVTAKLLTVDGDDLTASGSNSYASKWLVNRPTYTVQNRAVTASTLTSLQGRLSTVLSDDPQVFCVMIGTNDLPATDGAADTWVENLLTYTDSIRAGGAKVCVFTLPPKYIAGNATATTAYAAERVRVDNAIRAALTAGRIDAVVDLAADPIMGPDAAARDTSLYSDGTHPTTAGYTKIGAVSQAVVDQLFGLPPLPPVGGQRRLG
jgi:lysophospholipase L1-like esterase